MRVSRRYSLYMLAGLALPGLAAADTYPSRPVRLVLPFPPGGVFDIVGRPWADKVKTNLGTVFVDNQPGAGGSIAAQLVAHSPPDGYTIFLGTSSINLAEMILREHPLIDPTKDLTAISMVAITCFGIAIHPSVPAQNLKELIDYVKANPGKLSYGSSGAGTLNHLTGEALKLAAGLPDLTHVPYRGAGPAISDLIGGQVNAMSAEVPVLMPQIKAGKAKILAVAAQSRSEVMPDVPTFAELGYPDVVADNWSGVLAPPKTPAAIVARLNAAFNAVVKDPDVRRRMADVGVSTIGGTPEDLTALITSETARWHKVVEETGVKIER
jgi:tripartite-type tricarboxylate transporter receptor subunit TctC